jgi:hypothetical protein
MYAEQQEGNERSDVDKGRPRGENHLPLYILDILDLLVYKYIPSSHFISRLP